MEGPQCRARFTNFCLPICIYNVIANCVAHMVVRSVFTPVHVGSQSPDRWVESNLLSIIFVPSAN